MEAADLLIEQYRTVRQESLEALSQMQTINSWGFGSIGVSIGLGLVASQYSATATAVILMGLVPMLVAFGNVAMAVMAERVVEARRYLRDLERHLAEEVAGALPEFVGWERTRATGFRVGGSGFPFAIAATLGIAVAIGPGLGGALLATEGRWVAFAVGEAVDLAGLTLFAIWLGRWFVDMQTRNRDTSTGSTGLAEEPEAVV
jgi:hypothetical protein